MKKFVSLFAVNHNWEYFRCYADTKEKAQKMAISVYEDYVHDGFIKSYDYIKTWEAK